MWLYVSYLADAEAFVADYAELYRQAARRGTAVAIAASHVTCTRNVVAPRSGGATRLPETCCSSALCSQRRGRPEEVV